MSSFRSFVVFGCSCELLFGRKPSHIDKPGDMGVTGSHFLPATASLGGFDRLTGKVKPCV